MAANPYAGQTTYRPPGPQNPSKYPVTGPMYAIYGEQAGYVYDPYSDKYRPDPKAAQQYYESTGLIEKEPTPPGLGDMLLPIAGVGAALAGGKYVGENLGSIGSEIKDVGAGLLSGGTPTTATEAGSMLPGVSSGAGGAVPVGTAANGGTLMSDGSIVGGGVGMAPYLGAAGAALGAYGLYSGLKEGSSSQSALGGAGLAGGLAMAAPLAGFTPLGLPIIAGAALGGGLLGYGANALFGDKDMWETEKKRLQALADKGVPIPAGLLESMPTKGRSKDELIEIARATGGNVKFAESRNENDLTPADLQNFATILEKSHETGIPPQDLAARALAAKAVREHHGTIDVEWDKVNLSPQATQPPAQSAPQPPPAPQPAPQPAAAQSFNPGTRTPMAPQNTQPPPGLLGPGPNTRAYPMGNPQIQPQMNRPLPLPMPTVQASQPPPLQQTPPPPGLLSNTQNLAPAPPAQPGAPAPQPMPRPSAPIENQPLPDYSINGYRGIRPSGYDIDGNRNQIAIRPKGLLSVRS